MAQKKSIILKSPIPDKMLQAENPSVGTPSFPFDSSVIQTLESKGEVMLEFGKLWHNLPIVGSHIDGAP